LGFLPSHLLLASIGIYGVLATSSRNTNEIGVRCSGATQQNILLMIVRRGMLLTGFSVAIGLFAAFG
jgi:hypothetical protein